MKTYHCRYVSDFEGTGPSEIDCLVRAESNEEARRTLQGVLNRMLATPGYVLGEISILNEVEFEDNFYMLD